MFPTHKMLFDVGNELFAALQQYPLDIGIGAPHIAHVALQQGRWPRAVRHENQ
jgi:hypothetical protein